MLQQQCSTTTVQKYTSIVFLDEKIVSTSFLISVLKNKMQEKNIRKNNVNMYLTFNYYWI